MKRKILLLPLALALTATLASCDTAEERAEKHYQSALALIAEGDLDRARVEFRNVFKLDSTHRDARRAFAEMMEDSGNLGGALQNYLLLVEQYPNDGPATLKLAQIGVQTNRWDEADRYGKRAIELIGDNRETREVGIVLAYRDAVVTRDAQARSRAASDAEDFANEFSDSALVPKILLDWYSFEGRDREALDMVDRAIAAAPLDIGLYRARLAMLDRLGETPALEEQLREMVALFPGDPTVRQSLFAWLMQQGDVDGAESFLRELADNAEDPDQQAHQVALIQFLRQNRGSDIAQAEAEARLNATEDKVLFQSIVAGIQFDKGQQDEAIALLQAAIDGGGNSEHLNAARVVLARMHLSTGNKVGGRALVEEALAADASNIEAIKMKAGLLIDGDKGGEAIVLLRSGLEIAPNDADLMSIMASAHERNGDRQLMGDMLARAAEASNRAPNETLRLVRFLESQQQYSPAEQALVEALRRSPGNLNLLSALGRLYIRMEKPAEAAQVENALRDMGSDAAINAADSVKLGVLQLQNRSDDMIALIEGIGGRTSNTSRTVIALMRTHLAQGNPDKARDVIENAVAEQPDNLELRYARSVVLGATGDFEGAQADMRSILEVEPGALNVWMSLARSHSSAGDAKAGEAAVDEALVAIPEHPTLKWAKAGYLERRGEIGGAIDIYESLYDARSSSIIAANNLASLLTSYRETPETIERAYNIARRLRGIEQPAFQDTFGWIAFLRGDLDDALAHLEPAAAGLQNDPLVQYHLARVYEELDRKADAAIYYEKAIEILGNRENVAMADASERLAAVAGGTSE